jgi:hypothetical protein
MKKSKRVYHLTGFFPGLKNDLPPDNFFTQGLKNQGEIVGWAKAHSNNSIYLDLKVVAIDCHDL